MINFIWSQNIELDIKLNNDREYLIKVLTKMVDDDQYNRTLIDELEDQREVDLLWNIQDSLDRINIVELISITKKYGFPNPDRLKAPLPVWLIFQHTPKEFIKEVKELLKKENEEGRFYDNEYNLVSWHLGGRIELPTINDKDVLIIDLRNQ
jgi:hypothetical protein